MGTILNFHKIKIKPVEKRIGNLIFTNYYLDGNGKKKPLQSHLKGPKFSFFEIVKEEPNQLFGRESEYIKNNHGEYYTNAENPFCYIDESCFKHPYSRYMVACWDDINHDECSPDLRFCGGRPFELTNEEKLAFMELSEIGYRHISELLSNFVNEEDDL